MPCKPWLLYSKGRKAVRGKRERRSNNKRCASGRSHSASLPGRRMHAFAERSKTGRGLARDLISLPKRPVLPLQLPDRSRTDPGSATAPRSSPPASIRHRARPAGPTGAVSRPCGRSCPRPRQSPRIARHDRPHAPAPAARHERVPLADNVHVSAHLPSLHPLKGRSLRQTRSASIGNRPLSGQVPLL